MSPRCPIPYGDDVAARSRLGRGAVTLTQCYDPYGNVISSEGTGTSIYGFDAEQTDAATGMVYLRARYYDSSEGRFISRDTWEGIENQPMSYNRWIYGYSNPVKYTDPSGFFPTVYGIEVDDNFSEDEKALILETFSDYAGLLGGNDTLKRNLALVEVKRDWIPGNNTGRYEAVYYSRNKRILLQPGWYSPVIAITPNGQILIMLGPPSCFDELYNFPKGSLPTAEIGAKFTLAHEMTHSFAFGNPNAFRSFNNHVDLPWAIFAWFSSNPIIRRNAGRSLDFEVFADVIPAYIYSQGLLNQQMSDWVRTEMPGTLK